MSESLDECVELAHTAGLEVVEVLSRASRAASTWFVGEGKLEEVGERCAPGADLLVVNHELSAGQQRSLERICAAG